VGLALLNIMFKEAKKYGKFEKNHASWLQCNTMRDSVGITAYELCTLYMSIQGDCSENRTSAYEPVYTMCVTCCELNECMRLSIDVLSKCALSCVILNSALSFN